MSRIQVWQLKVSLSMLLLLVVAHMAVGFFFPSEAHADTGQSIGEIQFRQRLVKAEEDQARALQQIVRVLERMK